MEFCCEKDENCESKNCRGECRCSSQVGSLAELSYLTSPAAALSLPVKPARKTRENQQMKTRDPGNKDFVGFGPSADVSYSAARGASTASDNLAAHDFGVLGLGLR